MKESGNITVVLLGDEGVGKSSLVSTFVSRHFSHHVPPGILTRVRLPPDPSLSKCTTTIIDTQGGDDTLSNVLSLSESKRESLTSVSSNTANSTSSLERSWVGERDESSQSSTPTPGKHESASALLATTTSFRSVDAIILVYDLDKIETFHRVENHWLPLIEKCFQLPVIVAGNKLDLASTSSDGEQSPTRQQIISLLQQFKFVRQCIKVSAKEQINVDKLILTSQQSVLYPIGPLYDLNTGRLTAACTRAFTRIFRMFDTDNDGLLSDVELNDFQQKIWGVPLTERDLIGWKNMTNQHHGSDNSTMAREENIRDEKFTLSGFLTIFEVLITSQRLQVPWSVLRVLGYDEELNLKIPSSISSDCGDGVEEFDHLHPNDWRLTSTEIDFLTGIFTQFDSDGDGVLSSADLCSIFSVLPHPHPPWSEQRTKLFQGCFSIPRIENEETSPPSQPSSPSSIISASGVTITSSLLPSVEITNDSGSLCSAASSAEYKPLSFISWINRWHMIHTISPSIAKIEMYRLGHDYERRSTLVRKSMDRGCQTAPYISPSINMPSTFVRALILGSKNSGKRDLVQKLHDLPFRYLVESGCPTTSSSVSLVKKSNSGSLVSKEAMIHIILTELPELDLTSAKEKRSFRKKLGILLGRDKTGKSPYDMTVLTFDSNDIQSWNYAKDLEQSILTDDMPRLFFGTVSSESSSDRVLHEACKHCEVMDLEPPLTVSVSKDAKIDESALEHLVSCVEDIADSPFRSTPHGGRKRRAAARRKKALWIGLVVTAGMTVVLGFRSLAGRKRILSENGGRLSFLNKILPFQ